MLEDFDAALENAWDLGAELDRDLAVVEATTLIDKALDDLKHQRIVDTNKVTNWLLDLRNLING